MHKPPNVRHHHGGGLLLEVCELRLGSKSVPCHGRPLIDVLKCIILQCIKPIASTDGSSKIRWQELPTLGKEQTILMGAKFENI